MVARWRISRARSGVAVLVTGVAGSLLLAGCAQSAAPTAPTAPATSAGPAAAVQRVEVHFAGGVVQGGVSRVPIHVGSSVALVVSSDVGDEVHLHGYDRKVDVPAGGTATLEFVADQAGVFEAELESRGTQLVQLEVR